MSRGARGADETQVDTHESSTVLLQCRFPPITEKATFFWLTHTGNNAHDNAAIESTALAPHYRVFMRPEQGIYDLEIKNVSYNRDNGKYECRVKVSGTGENLYHKNITLTVLRAPGPPTISPVSAVAKEDERLELNCNTYGGSPEPEVNWYRGDSPVVVHTGKTYVLIPSKSDDKAVMKCTVRNRAMKSGEYLSASVTLDVHYYPRVTMNTENPLKVEVNNMATLKCNVDSKPAVGSVRWLKDGTFVATTFEHAIRKVTPQDAGKYTCQADNGLSKKGEASVYLNVLYPPQVYIEGDRNRVFEVEENVLVHCNVTSNPPPTRVEWLREGKNPPL